LTRQLGGAAGGRCLTVGLKAFDIANAPTTRHVCSGWADTSNKG
jgi:hypothetical protein